MLPAGCHPAGPSPGNPKEESNEVSAFAARHGTPGDSAQSNAAPKHSTQRKAALALPDLAGALPFGPVLPLLPQLLAQLLLQLW